MRAGSLRHRLTIQSTNSTGDGMGGMTFSQIRIRYTSDVTPAKRIQRGDSTQYFDIVSVVNPDYRNRELILYCREAL